MMYRHIGNPLRFYLATTKTKTHYQILELPKTASKTDIRKNYFRLAKIYHPDVYKGKDKTRFQNIKIAYEILSDDTKRKQYDESIGVSPRQTEEPRGQKIDLGKPENPMSYESTSKATEGMNLDEEYSKFFKTKKKTQFEEIRLHEQPEIRSMSESERIRRRVAQVFESADAMYQNQYQKETFEQILDDQIGQKNQYVQDKVDHAKKMQELHSEKSVNRLRRWIISIGTVIGTVGGVLMLSWWTKFSQERKLRDKQAELWEDFEKEIERMEIRSRIQY